jgi:predicted membrane protein
MIITLDLTWMITFLPFLLIGFGFGIAFYYMFYSNNSMTEIERKKHDIAVRKEWFKMLADQKTKNSKWPANWS